MRVDRYKLFATLMGTSAHIIWVMHPMLARWLRIVEAHLFRRVTIGSHPASANLLWVSAVGVREYGGRYARIYSSFLKCEKAIL